MPEEAGCPSDPAVDRYVWQPGLLNKREATALGVWSLRLDRQRGLCFRKQVRRQNSQRHNGITVPHVIPLDSQLSHVCLEVYLPL